ncbi:hypothetical protein HDR58_04605 [bacterium]|nr:hypothetical protein [bacterium]
MIKRTFLISVLMFIPIVGLAKNADMDEIYSTQGIEIETSAEKSKIITEEKNEQKQDKNRSKIYILNKKKIEIEEFRKNKKQKELEYLEKRLELKKNKLENRFPVQEKGEQK